MVVERQILLLENIQSKPATGVRDYWSLECECGRKLSSSKSNGGSVNGNGQ